MVSNKILRIWWRKGELEKLEKHGYNIDQLGRRFEREEALINRDKAEAERKSPKQPRKSWKKYNKHISCAITSKDYDRLKRQCWGQYGISYMLREALSKFLDYSEYKDLDHFLPEHRGK